MKKLLIPLLTLALFSGCYTTFYPIAGQMMENSDAVPDSTRQIIINNYYETTEYYQVPHYQRYSLLWGSYYWDPFYYDYSYYRWVPYYWYGTYYYYNPYNRYWYYYDHHHPWSGGSWSGGSGSSQDQERIRKPGYNTLMSAPTDAAPFISVSENNDTRIDKPGKKIGVDVNTGLSSSPSDNGSPYIESVGKKPGPSYAPSTSTVKSGPKTPATTISKKPSPQSDNNSSGSSSGSKSKPSSTSSTSSKNTNNESSSETSKKSK